VNIEPRYLDQFTAVETDQLGVAFFDRYPGLMRYLGDDTERIWYMATSETPMSVALERSGVLFVRNDILGKLQQPTP
jgi:hypothetical protein